MKIYTDKTLKNWQAGRQWWCFAIIRPSYRGVADIEAHELEHVKQWWLATILSTIALGFCAFVAHRNMGININQLAPFALVPPNVHGLLYLMSKNYRLRAEVAAYRVSMQHRPDGIDHYAKLIATKYKLRISTYQAKRLLSAQGPSGPFFMDVADD